MADPRLVAEALWSNIEASAGYGFNKCVTGDTVVHLAGANQQGFPTIGALYRRLNAPVAKTSDHVGECLYCGTGKDAVWRGVCKSCWAWHKKWRNKGVYAQSMCQDGRIRTRRIKAVHENGLRGVYRITLENGMSITSTSNHRHLSDSGWKSTSSLVAGDRLKVVGDDSHLWSDAYDYSLSTGVASYSGAKLPNRERNGVNSLGYIDGGHIALQSWTKRQDWSCSVSECGKSKANGDRIERAHLDGNRKNNRPDNLKMMCASHHKAFDYQNNGRAKRWDRGRPATPSTIISIEYAGEETVYDLEMCVNDGEDTGVERSWVANGIITHNSHSQGYAMTAAWEVSLSHNHPREFLTACLRTDTDSARRSVYLREARRKGINILPPDVNISGERFTLTEEGIRFGLGDVRSVGPTVVQEIVRHQPYESLQDFSERTQRSVCKVNVLTALIKVGAFDKILKATLDKADLPYAGDLTDRAMALEVLFQERKPKDRTVPDFSSEQEVYDLELELVGTFITQDPMGDYIDIITETCAQSTSEVDREEVGSQVFVGGQIVSVREHKTQRGTMCFLNVEWTGQEFDFVCFAEKYESLKPFMKEGAPVIVEAEKTDRGLLLRDLLRLDFQR